MRKMGIERSDDTMEREVASRMKAGQRPAKEMPKIRLRARREEIKTYLRALGSRVTQLSASS